MGEKEIYGGLVRLHVLHHACHEPIFGQGIMDELAHHGYRLGPGTMYPILHGLERGGYLKSSVEKVGKRNRRTYIATAAGRKALNAAKGRVWELFRELFEDELSSVPRNKVARDGKTMKKTGEGQ
ncbi:MAG: helix-turn-helix transcriptional regulator [Betaproteobacteria bacterium]|nr:helix-turn-helix transcriptional regulator [Betaproteobacteria bacterium]